MNTVVNDYLLGLLLGLSCVGALFSVGLIVVIWDVLYDTYQTLTSKLAKQYRAWARNT